MDNSDFSNSEFEDYYALIGVGRDASDEEIREAYRKRVKKVHPDVNPGDVKAEAEFRKITEAYTVLSDPVSRENYDQMSARNLVPFLKRQHLSSGKIIRYGVAASLLFGAGVFASGYIGQSAHEIELTSENSSTHAIQTAHRNKKSDSEHVATIRNKETSGTLQDRSSENNEDTSSDNKVAEPVAEPKRAEKNNPAQLPGVAAVEAEKSRMKNNSEVAVVANVHSGEKPLNIHTDSSSDKNSQVSGKKREPETVEVPPVPNRNPFRQEFRIIDEVNTPANESGQLARLDKQYRPAPVRQSDRPADVYENDSFENDRRQMDRQPVADHHSRRNRFWNWYLRTHCEPVHNELFRCVRPSEGFIHRVRQSFGSRGKPGPLARRIRNAWLNMKEQLCSPSSDDYLICERP